ncbi:fatty-acid amide hydrolase [Aspergillus granulosus]|uniref:amidase n=1 Tax=Aspergillus granulosus TaxID=176169 RepID=A0ABR4HA32_9EURO
MTPTQETQPLWQRGASKKRQECKAKISNAWLVPETLWDSLPHPLESNKVNLIELDVIRRSNVLTEGELDKLSTGEFTAVEVTSAVCKRAAVAGQLSGNLKGPLHGLPISVKDCLHVAGTQETENSCLVDMLLDLGAVMYIKTNVPQTMMTADSENIIFGRTLSPWNTMLTAGGSSGGEEALIALRGSPLGIGTDVAGSIRIPALCCGTYGFKPSASRIPDSKQQRYGSGGIWTIYGSVGPLANDMEALEILTRAVLGANPRPALYDPDVLDIPWRNIGPLNPRLRLGFLLEDPAFPLHPPVRATRQAAASCLKEAGHEIIPLSAEECHIAYALEVVWKLFSFDDSDAASEVVAQGGEPPIASRAVVATLAERLGSRYVPGFKDMTPIERLSTLNMERVKINAAWHALWKKHDLDAVICPPAPNTAVEHDKHGLTAYTSFMNLLDYPACVIPFQKAGKYSDVKMQEGQFVPDYHSAALEGAPCSVQVFTSRLRDEECLAIAKVVDRCLHSDQTS